MMKLVRTALLAMAIASVAAGGRVAASSAPGEVLYFDRATVEAAFAKGSVLLDGSDGRTYMVHASRRDAAGLAEVHDRDTDILYVLEGSATFVTGGSVEGSKETAPGEHRGEAIRGGESRTISKGDVVVVPAGVPHWFREVPATLLYYVVKVRS